MTEAPLVDTLIQRLCDLDTDVVYFPVRHHSPASAILVDQLIDRMRPSAVLVEGPSDFNDRIDELLLDHELPIAIYSYFRTGEMHSGAYYPFCEYSPEWSALRSGRSHGAIVRFIDLPWTKVARDDKTTHRYADAELRRGRYIQDLCERLHVHDFDELWDKLIESQQPLELKDYLQRVHSLCFHIRLWEASISRSDQLREAFMSVQIQKAREELAGPLLVVTGGYHSSALAAMREGWRISGIDVGDNVSDIVEEELATAPDLSDAGISLTTYSYERLDNLTGYNSGMPSPGFYDHVWRQRQAGIEFDHQQLLSKLVQELRQRKQTLSTADLIAVETSARGLAALRGRMHVWRNDLVDAVMSTLVKDELEYGCTSPFLSAIHAVLRGSQCGRLAAGTPMPPLVLDIRRQLTEADLASQHIIRNVELDLLSPNDVPKSLLLHRLNVLGIVGYDLVGGTDFLGREDLGKIWELWRIRWSPEFEASCIEASRYGIALADAVAARLTEEAGEQEHDATAAAALLVKAARAGIDTLSESFMQRLSGLILEETRFTNTTSTLKHILFLFCHDEVFGTKRLPQVGRLLGEAFGRSLWLLEILGQSTGKERLLLEGMKVLLEAFQRSGDSIEIEQPEFVGVMLRVEQDVRKPSTVRGAAAGILWTLQAANEEQILANLLLFTAPNELGDFLAGLFALAREVVQRHDRLVLTIDRRLNEFNSHDFQASLPSMRLAFTYFTPREKHYMLKTLFESLGLQETQPLTALEVDQTTAAEALALEERLFEIIAKYGLEETDE